MSTLSALTVLERNALEGTGGFYRPVSDGSRWPYHVPTIYTMNLRQNAPNYGWSSGDFWTTYYNYMANGNDQIRLPWYALAGPKYNGLDQTTQDGTSYKEVQYALMAVAGGEDMVLTPQNNSANGVFSMRTIFIRNTHPTTAKSITLWTQSSNYWSNGYEGSALVAIDPQSSLYSTATACSYTTMWQRTGGNSNYTDAASYTIQPGRTVMFILTTSAYFWTSGYSYKWMNINKFYNLQATFGDGWIQPDFRLHQTAMSMNDFDDNNYSGNVAHRIWNRAAELYGDR